MPSMSRRRTRATPQTTSSHARCSRVQAPLERVDPCHAWRKPRGGRVTSRIIEDVSSHGVQEPIEPLEITPPLLSVVSGLPMHAFCVGAFMGTAPDFSTLFLIRNMLGGLVSLGMVATGSYSLKAGKGSAA